MEPTNTVTPSPNPTPAPSQPDTFTTPPPASQPEVPKRGKGALWAALVILVLLIAGGIAFAALHKSNTSDKKPTASTTTHNNITGTGTDSKKLAIQSVTLSSAATAGYTQNTGTVTAGSFQSAMEKQGLSNYFNFTGVSYFTSSDSSSVRMAIWGTPGNAYSHAGYMKAISQPSNGVTLTVSDLPQQSVKASNGKSYDLTCSLVTSSLSGTTSYSAYCDSPSVGGNGYLNMTASGGASGDDVVTSLKQFIQGATVNLK